LACQDEFIVNNLLDSKENDEHAFDFSLHLSHLFSVLVSLGFLCAAHDIFPKRLSNHCLGLRRCAQNLILFPCRIHHIIPDIQLQIKGHKKISMSKQLRKILYNDSQDLLVLSSTIASHFYN
jgi:hypothetical protein